MASTYKTSSSAPGLARKNIPTQKAPLSPKKLPGKTLHTTPSKSNIPDTPNLKEGIKAGQKVLGEKITSDSKKGLRAFLVLTPQEKKRRGSISKKIRHLLRQRRLDTTFITEEDPATHPKRYKRPIEKLLKRVKTARRDELPSDAHIHRRRFLRSSFIGSPAVRKEVDLIRDVLTKNERKVQPQVGFDYSKKQRRVLLGFRHRELSKSWNYFGGLKYVCPRRLKPNSHLPDAIFFVVNLIIFISTGVTFGFSFASDGFLRILEESYEYELFRKNEPNLEHQGHQFWTQLVPFDYFENWYYISIMVMFISQLLGFVGIYVADQRFHLAYVIGMVASLFAEGVISSNISDDDTCPAVQQVLRRLLGLLVENYYETIEARDENGVTLVDPTTKIPVQIRTYKAANLMDIIQRGLHCCGVDSLKNYTSNGWSVPPSCCTPLWNLNPHCADVIPTDKLEYRSKLQIAEGVDLGCLDVLTTMCHNIQRMMGSSSLILNLFQWFLFLIGLIPLVMQARQIRQLRRWPHLRISAGSISQSLQASAGNEGVKTGGGGVRAVVEASKFTEKQQERLQQTRREALSKAVVVDEESSSSSEESSGELPVHTVNFGQLKNLQQFVDTEDKTNLEMPDLDKTVEGFAGRFNILANKNLQNYVSGIFSTTYQNETNAGLEAISQTLEKQFAQHTTDYNWRKLLTKPKPPVTVTKVPGKSHSHVHVHQSQTDVDNEGHSENS